MGGQRLFMILALMLLSSGVYAQDSVYAITFGSGWAYNTTQDLAVTPLLYHGHQGYLSLGYHDPMSELEGTFQMGQLQTGQSPFNSTGVQFGGRIEYRQYIGLPFVPDEHMNIGLGWLTNGAFRQYPLFVNNDLQYDFASALSLEYRYRYILPFTLKGRELHLRWHASLPLAALVVRPGYNTAAADGFLPQDEEGIGAFLSSVEGVTLNNYWRFISQLSLELPFKNGNRMAINYRWDVYQFNLRNRLTSGTHQAGLTLFLNTAKR